MPIRVGAVSYLNSRPLVLGLERWPDRFRVRYDVPSRCAELLHSGQIDLGLIPAIEYLRGDYQIVPDVAVASDGPVASVALFTKVPVEQIQSIALDTSSRTSATLIRVLCAEHFGISPEFVHAEPDLAAMVARHDAALLIGERALFGDAAGTGTTKVDLGDEWKAFTGLPFVYAFWAGVPGMLTSEDIARLQEARAAGERESDAVAEAFFPGDPDRQREGARYLRENIRFRLGPREQQGFLRFMRLAHAIGSAPPPRPLRFYGSAAR
ncbi:MAG TPA: menaquinone biosynthesis protein [Vicinamibacterales bacterium]|nr:menaquinone biosynthesis protein [Vicinamibacterales bacterium]